MFADHKKERERIKKLRASPAARASEMWGRKNLPGSLPANEEAAPTWHAPRPPLPIPLFLSPRRWSLQLIGGSGAHRHHTGSSSSSPRLPGRGTGHQFTMGDSSSSSAAYIRMVCVCCCTISTTNGWSWLFLTSFVRAAGGSGSPYDREVHLLQPEQGRVHGRAGEACQRQACRHFHGYRPYYRAYIYTGHARALCFPSPVQPFLVYLPCIICFNNNRS